MFPFHFSPRALVLCGALFLCAGVRAQTTGVPSVSPASANAVGSDAAPPEAKREGAPLRDGERTLFRFRAPTGAVKVFLAGSFNGYANNTNGAVTDEAFALNNAGGGFFWTRAFVDAKPQSYKYVVLDGRGKFTWLPDPNVTATDADGNTALDFGKLERIPASPNREGAPLRDGGDVLFRFRAPSDAVKVFLAGSFNGFANNANGAISDNAFALSRDASGLYQKRVTLGKTKEKYKYVVQDKNGHFVWLPDPSVKDTDDDGNSVVDFGAIEKVG